MRISNFKYVGLLFLIVSCSDDATEVNNNSDEITPVIADYSPNTIGSYWIYDIESSSSDLEEMNFTDNDSLYVLSSTGDDYTLGGNTDNDVLGTMSTFLVNGALSKSTNQLSYTGGIEIPVDLGVDSDFSIENMPLYDLNASNGTELYNAYGTNSQTLDFDGTALPIQVEYEITVTKENFYTSTSINGQEFTNVYEGRLTFNLSVSGSFTLLGFTQTINIIQPQDVIEVRYYYAENIGLIGAEATQGYTLDPELTSLFDLTGSTIDFPTSISVTNTQELSSYELN
jgi:hypothetical protein